MVDLKQFNIGFTIVITEINKLCNYKNNIDAYFTSVYIKC